MQINRVAKYRSQNNQGAGRIRGQAIVEYILILVVIVVVVGGLLFRFSKGVQAWGKVLFGEDGYVACALQTGVLPGLISMPECLGTQDASDVFADVTGDISHSGGSSGKYNQVSGGGEGGASGKDTKSSGKVYSDPAAGGESGTDSSQNKKGSSGRNSRSSSAAEGGSGYQPSGQLLSLGGESSLGSPGSKKKRKKRRQARGSSRRKQSFGGRGKIRIKNGYDGGDDWYEYDDWGRALYSGGYFEEEREQKTRQTPIALTTKKSQSFRAKKKKQFLVKKIKKSKSKEVEVSGWTFGNIFSIILIIAVIVVSAFFIFNQMSQVKKSM